jgi:hypothetical protein
MNDLTLPKLFPKYVFSPLLSTRKCMFREFEISSLAIIPNGIVVKVARIKEEQKELTV